MNLARKSRSVFQATILTENQEKQERGLLCTVMYYD